jgi:hypothetical protein
MRSTLGGWPHSRSSSSQEQLRHPPENGVSGEAPLMLIIETGANASGRALNKETWSDERKRGVLKKVK